MFERWGTSSGEVHKQNGDNDQKEVDNSVLKDKSSQSYIFKQSTQIKLNEESKAERKPWSEGSRFRSKSPRSRSRSRSCTRSFRNGDNEDSSKNLRKLKMSHTDVF